MSDQITINITPDQNVSINPITLNQGLINHSVTHQSGGSDELAHNLLGGLQGGSGNQFYHLSSGQYFNLTTGDVVRPSETGQFYSSSNPSGYTATGYVTGVSGNLQTQITSLNNQTGSFYPRTNPSGYAATGYVTGISGSLQNQITTLNNATGSYVLTSQTGNFITDTQTGVFYPRSNPSGYITGVDLSFSGNYYTKTESESRYVNTTGAETILGDKTFHDKVYINNLYVTGLETIINTTNTNVASNYLLLNLTGGAVDGGIFFITGSGLTGINDSGAIIGFDHSDEFKFGISTRASDLSTLNTIASVEQMTGISGGLQTQISTLNNQTGSYVLNSQTGQFYPNSNPSGYISSLLTSRTIYVDTNGTDTRGSLSQYSISVPFATIGAAMAASVIGDTVRVRAGSYQITSTINLNGEGYLHLEEGAVVTCSVTAGGPVFSLTANESKSISGGGQFIITGSTTTFWVQSGGGLQTQLCSVECATINTTTSPLNAATIFDVSTGVLVVNAETVYALSSTIIRCAGTSSNLHYAVKFTYCSRFAHFPTSGSQAQMSCDCWTIACYGAKCFEIVGGWVGAKYETLSDFGNNCTFFSLEYGNDSTANALVIKGGRAITYSTNPCIRFTTTTGTSKVVRLIGDPFFYTNGDNSITAASARTVLSSFASSNKAVGGSVTIVGTYSVRAGFIA